MDIVENSFGRNAVSGEDSTTNTVALCPNCYAKMHVMDRQEDIDVLLKVCKKVEV